MASQRPLRFGAIGTGNAGTARICALAGNPLGLKVEAAVDLDSQRLDNLVTRLGYDFVRYTGDQDFKRLIDENKLDAVGIFTPHIPHYEHVHYAISKGMNVLIEKPMVCGAARALEITRLMQASGKVGIIHYQRHYEGKFLKARAAISRGVIGEVTNFFVYMAQDWCAPTWRGIPALSGGGQINDSGSHYQDILLWMLDTTPVSAEGHVDSFYRGRKLQVEANGSFNVELANGVTGRIIILSDIPGGFADDVRIVGTKGSLSFQGDKLILFDNARKSYYELPSQRPASYPENPCDNFVKLLRRKTRVNHVPFIFGCRVALLTETMLRSAHAGGKKVLCADILAESGHTLADLQAEA